MAITAAQVKKLRDKTGVAMMACKKALEETNGNIEEAIEVLRKRGAAKAASKSDRSTSEGRVAISGNVIIKVLCETDFVGKNENFIAYVQKLADAGKNGEDAIKSLFEATKTDKIQEIGENIVLDSIVTLEGEVISGYVHSNGKVGTLVALSGGTEEQAKDLAMHATAMNPSVANPEDVDQELIDKEITIYKEQLANEGKPEKIWDMIIKGKVEKFCAGQALTSQAFVKDSSITVAEYLGDAKLLSFKRLAI
jgi:elongation factor Ts